MLGVACGAGAPDPRCADGPQALRASGLIERLRCQGLDAVWSGNVEPPAGADPCAVVSAVATALARRAGELATHGRLPIVLGGDHTCAVGTWTGIAGALAVRGPLGLVWIDAHMDAHTPSTSPSGMLHGMPLACLLGHGDPRLTAITGDARLDPGRVCLVGVRNFETGEAALLRRLGVRVFFMHEVARRGLDAVLADALATAGEGAAGVGLSLDLDALDPRDAPGVGTPAPGGIRGTELVRSLARTAASAALAGVEIVEYNPYRDRGGVTARLVGDVLGALPVKGRSLQLPAMAAPSSNDARYAAPFTRRRAA